MKNFCMPADFKKETIDRYEKLNRTYHDSRVIETYGNITLANAFGSGRNLNKLPQVDWAALQEYVAYSKQKGIGFNYTINASFMQNRELTPTGIEEIRHFLDELVKTGVESLTLALPSLIELVRICGYPFRIKASTICQISNANKAALFKKSGVDGMVFDESITRDFEALRRVRNAFGAGTEIIVNSICYQDCQYRMFHYNQISGDSVRDCSELSCSYYPTRCLSRSYEDLSIFAKCSWIRPEDLHYYSEIGIEHFKVQGRQSVLTGDPVRVVEAYMKEEFDGNLRDLLFMFAPSDVFGIPVDNKAFGDFLRPFFEKPGFCVRDCQAHGYCDGIARKCVDVSKADALAGMMLKTIRERDPFRKLLLKKP